MRKLLVALVTLVVIGVSGAASAGSTKEGTLATAKAGAIDYTVYLPYGYAARKNAKVRYPVLYLLHGRGDTMQAWTRIKADLDALIADGSVPPVIAVLPDAAWSERGSWYVDSAYESGSQVETALTRDLVSHVDATYRTAAHRGARLVGGYSMGGYGALRYALAHQDLFANALVLSPAVYNPLPPADSSAREYGGFGQGGERFVDEVYQRLNYPALLSGLDRDLPVNMYIAVGDDEWANPDPADAKHDLDYEAATLYNAVRRSDAISAEFRVLDGGHGWDVWRPAFVAGLQHLSTTLSATPPTGLPAPRGTAGTDWAGGVAADGTLAYAASVQNNGLDAVVEAPRWTRQFGTPANDRLYGAVNTPDGGVIVAGYTRGDLDGKHPGSPADDAFVARFTATGKRAWLTQIGDPAKADRFYGLAAAPDGGAYVAGYTSGAFAGPSAGDKDVTLARIGPDGTVAWTRQIGGAGEDKAYAVAAGADGVYVAGVTSAGLPGALLAGSLRSLRPQPPADSGLAASRQAPDSAGSGALLAGSLRSLRPQPPADSGGSGASHLGGTDGFLAAFGVDGAPLWVAQDGSTGDDLFGGVAVAANGTVVATGTLGGDATAGARDVLTAAYGTGGAQRWRTVSGGKGDDGGAEVVALPGGDVTVVGFTGSAFGVPAGGADVFTLRLDSRGRQRAAAQLGSARDDGVDAFGEENLYATLAGDRLLITGLTNGDVFLTEATP